MTYEAVVARQVLYESGMKSRKFVPVLRDGGRVEHVPIDLRDFSRYVLDRDYSGLIKHLHNEPDLTPRPVGGGGKKNVTTSHIARLPIVSAGASDLDELFRAGSRRLVGWADPLLNPERGRFLGREDELDRVLAFLRGHDSWATVSASHVIGTGGIGKTELCKAALREWLREVEGRVAYYVGLAGARTTGDTLAALAQSVEAEAAGSAEEVLRAISTHPGLYYLDNLESIVDDPTSMRILERLRKTPGVRVLSSSRVDLSGFGSQIRLEKLADKFALELFEETWNEAGGAPITAESRAQLWEFVGAGVPPNVIRRLAWNLGCHPLSIVLVAAQGAENSFEEIVARWNEEGTRLAATNAAGAENLQSLDISLSLTLRSLEDDFGPRRLWGIVAFFPQGMSHRAWDFFLKRGHVSFDDRTRLIRNHIVQRSGASLEILPPLARFALDRAAAEAEGFSLAELLKLVGELVADVSHRANENEKTARHVETLDAVLAEFPTIHRFVLFARDRLAGAAIPISLVSDLRNIFQLRSLQSQEILESLVRAELSSSETERANALQSLGDLESGLRNWSAAFDLYVAARALYEKERDPMGLAYTCAKLARVFEQTGREREAKASLAEAREAAPGSGVPAVLDYVLAVERELFP